MANAYFKGFMCPTFTAFDENGDVVYDVVDAYCQYLSTNSVNGVLVNGTTGEGTCLSVDERKKTAEVWQTACRKYKMAMMVQIGGCAIADVFELAKHAEKIAVDYVLCLPDIYFKPKTEVDLVTYFEHVAKRCPTRPLYYYHIPRMSGVDLNMPKFCELAEAKIPTFRGLKYTSGDMEMAVKLVKPNRNILIGSDIALICALSIGIDAAILTTLNIHPKIINTLYQQWISGDHGKALTTQRQLNGLIDEILADGSGEWVESMKKEFNKMQPSGLQAGSTRKL